MPRDVRRLAFILSAIQICTGISRASVTYDDVAVIVNVNSDASKEIGSYFQRARNIPDVNMIYVSVPEQEVIDDTTFASMRSQIETHLCAHNLTGFINYLVTTRGDPLKVNREVDGAEPFSQTSSSASVESELSLILGPNSSNIGLPGRTISPYYNAAAHFSRVNFGIYLVTRLDGYTVRDVLDLIDRAHPGITPDGSSVFLFDQDPAWNSRVPYLNSYLADAATTLLDKGKNVRLNNDSIYVTYASDVLGYISWGSNDHYAEDFTQNAIPHNSWAPGAISETYVSTSARSFDSPPLYGQSLIADLVAEGVSGAKGYVYEPYSSAMAVGSILFNLYTGGFNLAESYYQSSVYLSWMDVIVGDPKTSIDGNASIALPVQLSSLSAIFDPGQAKVTLRWTTQSEIQNYGFMVQRRPAAQGPFCDIQGSFVAGAGNTLAVHNYAYDDPFLSPGSYEYRLKQTDLDGSVHYCEPVAVAVTSTTGTGTNPALPSTFRLGQNYPNPFNPKTVVSSQWTVDSNVRLVVYDLLGHEVAVLADGRYPPGKFSFTFDGTGLASGIYLYRLEAGASVETKTMVLMK
ncbi:MAG: TIGR03790 family protein [Bacteroidota bacterium]